MKDNLNRPKNSDKIENHPNDTTLAYTSKEDNIEIISVDKEGCVSWKKIEGIN